MQPVWLELMASSLLKKFFLRMLLFHIFIFIFFWFFFLNFLLAAGMQQLDPIWSVGTQIVPVCRSGFKTTYYYMDFTFRNLESPHTCLETIIAYWIKLVDGSWQLTLFLFRLQNLIWWGEQWHLQHYVLHWFGRTWRLDQWSTRYPHQSPEITRHLCWRKSEWGESTNSHAAWTALSFSQVREIPVVGNLC